MLNLRIIAGGRAVPVIDLPVLLGAAKAAKAIGDQIDALIDLMDALTGDAEAEDADGDVCEAADDGCGPRLDWRGRTIWGSDMEAEVAA